MIADDMSNYDEEGEHMGKELFEFKIICSVYGLHAFNCKHLKLYSKKYIIKPGCFFYINL